METIPMKEMFRLVKKTGRTTWRYQNELPRLRVHGCICYVKEPTTKMERRTRTCIHLCRDAPPCKYKSTAVFLRLLLGSGPVGIGWCAPSPLSTGAILEGHGGDMA